MKNCILHIFVIILATSILSGCPQNRSSSVRNIVTSENTEADLGTIKEEDGLVQVNLIVKNETGDTIRPLRTYAYCRCTTAEIDRTPVPPGENIVVPVTYNPAYKSGRFMEEIQVYYNDPHHLLSLIIKGEVIPAKHSVEEDYPYYFGNKLHLSHETLHFGLKSSGEEGEIFIRLANEAEKAVDVEFTPDAEHSDIIKARHIHIAAHGRDTLTFHFKAPEGLGPADTLFFGVKASVNGKELPKRLNIKAIGK